MEQWKLVAAGGAIALLGMAAGAWVFGASPARAQRTYTQCFFGVQEAVDINASGTVTTPGANYMINVPAGWDVVGGGGPGLAGDILFCR